MKNPAFKICEVTSCCSTEAYEKLEVVFCGVSRRDWTKKSSSSWTRAQHKHRMDAGDQSGPVICTLCDQISNEGWQTPPSPISILLMSQLLQECECTLWRIPRISHAVQSGSMVQMLHSVYAWLVNAKLYHPHCISVVQLYCAWAYQELVDEVWDEEGQLCDVFHCGVIGSCRPMDPVHCNHIYLTYLQYCMDKPFNPGRFCTQCPVE